MYSQYLTGLAELVTVAFVNLGLHRRQYGMTGQLADAVNRSICCFNCMIGLCGHNTTNRITSEHTQENINKWSKNEN